MRNKYTEAMFFMFMLCLSHSVGFGNATEPVVTSDTVVNGTVSNTEVIKSVHNNTEIPMIAFVLSGPALKTREDLEESPRKTTRHPSLVGADMSWAEFWSLPSDLSSYKFGMGKREERAAHYKSLIRTASKRHVRRQMRRAAFKANRAHVKKRRKVRPKNRALKAKLKEIRLLSNIMAPQRASVETQLPATVDHIKSLLAKAVKAVSYTHLTLPTRS